MIFRRVKAHIEKENWFAVFIDFVIVVFGVFMGFQVQTWNENRTKKADAVVYIERLAADMDISIAGNNKFFRAGEDRVSQTKLIISVLESCTLPVEDKVEFTSGLYNLGKHNLPSLITSTIDELNATGKFYLIGEASLQRKISDNVRGYQAIQEIESQLSGRVLPSVNYVRTKVRFNLDEFLTTGTKVDPDSATYDFETLCSDQSFINAVAAVREIDLAVTRFTKQTIDWQIEVRDELYSQLNVLETTEETN